MRGGAPNCTRVRIETRSDACRGTAIAQGISYRVRNQLSRRRVISSARSGAKDNAAGRDGDDGIGRELMCTGQLIAEGQ